MKKLLIGDTVKFTWISSATVASDIYAAVYDGNETLVNSVTMTASGNGHYYSNYTLVDTEGFFVAEMTAIVNGLPYKRREKFRSVSGEVD